MLLYVVRHGDALPGEPDGQRPLSPIGIKDAMTLAGFLKKKEMRPSAIYHSGLKRARETAEILAKGLGSRVRVLARSSLLPEDPIQSLCDDLSKNPEDVMIVGHLPSLSNLVSRLITGSERKEIIDFKKGALVVLERNNNGEWKIKWFIIPKLL